MSKAANFNFQIVVSADIARAKAGLTDVSTGMKDVSAEAGKATAATKKEAAALAELAAAAAKATLTQSDLASAERRAAEGRRRASAVPVNVLSQTARPTSSLNASAQGIRNTSAAANSLGQSVSGLNTEKRAKVGDALRGGISRRCRVAVNSLLRKGYATCQRLPSLNCPIHRVLHLTRSPTSFGMERAN